MDLNKAMIIGRLTRDPEIRTTPNGITVASFSVATNFTWTDQAGQKQNRSEFHNIVVWRRLAEICGQYLKKGSKIYVEGRLQTRDWVGQDNVKRYRTEIIADNMIMLDSKGATTANNLPDEQPYSASEPVINVDDQTPNNFSAFKKDSNEASGAGSDDEEEIKVENIPF